MLYIAKPSSPALKGGPLYVSMAEGFLENTQKTLLCFLKLTNVFQYCLLELLKAKRTLQMRK